MVASKISVLISSLSDGFTNRSVFVKLGKVKCDTWGSALLKLIPRVHLKLSKKSRPLYLFLGTLVWLMNHDINWFNIPLNRRKYWRMDEVKFVIYSLKETILLHIFYRLLSTNFSWSILECFVPNGGPLLCFINSG